MTQVVKFPTKEDFDAERICATAARLLSKNKPLECLSLLNRFDLDDMTANKHRGAAFSAIQNFPLSNFCYHKALKRYFKKGGLIKDKSVKPIIRELVNNNLELQNVEAVGYYLSLIKDMMELPPALEGESRAVDKAFRDFALSLQFASMPFDGIEGEAEPDENVLEVMLRAKKLASEEKYRQAVGLLEKHIDEAGEQTCAFYEFMADCCTHFDDEQTIVYADKILEIMPYSVAALCYKFEGCCKTGKKQLADECAKTMSEEFDPNELGELIRVFNCLAKYRYYDHILQLGKKLMKCDKNEYVYNKIYALALNFVGRTQEALAVAKKQFNALRSMDDAVFLVHYLTYYHDKEINCNFDDFIPDEMIDEMAGRLHDTVSAFPLRYSREGVSVKDDSQALRQGLRAFAKDTLAYDFFMRFGTDDDDIEEKMGIISYCVFGEDYKEFAPLRERIADMLLDEDVDARLKEELIYCIYMYSHAGNIYYVHGGRMYRMDTSMPGVIQAEGFVYKRAYLRLRIRGVLGRVFSLKQLNDAVENVVGKLISKGIDGRVKSSDTVMKMILYYINNKNVKSEDSAKLLDRATDIDFVEKNVDLNSFLQ